MATNDGPSRSTRSPLHWTPLARPPAHNHDLNAWQRLVLRRIARNGLDPADVMTEVYEVRGILDLAWLDGTIGGIIERHVALRTAYQWPGGASGGVGYGGGEVSDILTSDDLHGWRRTREELVIDPIDSPLLRVDVARVAPERHLLAVSGHEIAFDGWSYGVLLDELTLALRGRSPRRLDQRSMNLAHRSPLDHPASAAALLQRTIDDWPISAEGRSLAGPAIRRVIRLPGFTSTRLQVTARAIGVGDLAALLSAVRIAVLRHLDVREVVVGVPAMSRTEGEEHLIGPFTDIALVDGSINPTRSLHDLIVDQQSRLFSVLDGRSFLLGEVLEVLGLDESVIRMTVTVEPDHQPFTLPGLELEYLPVERRRMRPDLCVVGSRDEDGIEIFIDARLDTVGRELHGELCAAAVEALEAIAHDPTTPVSDLVAGR